MTKTQGPPSPGHGHFATDTRVVEWARPGQGDFARVVTATGLEQLQMMLAGDLPRPPIMDTLGMTGFHAEPGRVMVEMAAQPFHYNPHGGVSGGVISTVLDTAAACAVHSTLAVGEMYTSLDLTVKFLRPVTAHSGLLTCEGTVLQRGRRTALAQAELRDAAGKVVAHALSSCLILT